MRLVAGMLCLHGLSLFHPEVNVLVIEQLLQKKKGSHLAVVALAHPQAPRSLNPPRAPLRPLRTWPFLLPLACRGHSEGLSHFMPEMKAPGQISTSFLSSSSLVLFQENPFCIQDPFPPLTCL